MSKCNHPGCENTPEFAVIFELRAIKDGVAAQTTPIIVVCKEHMDVEWKDVYDENSFNKLGEMFEQMGKMRPKKEFSNIAIISISELPKDIAEMYNKIKSNR